MRGGFCWVTPRDAVPLAMLVNSAAVLRVLGGDMSEVRRLATEIDSALARIAIGGAAAGLPALTTATAALEAELGAGHPNVVAAKEKRWHECDIEPPATWRYEIIHLWSRGVATAIPRRIV